MDSNLSIWIKKVEAKIILPPKLQASIPFSLIILIQNSLLREKEKLYFLLKGLPQLKF